MTASIVFGSDDSVLSRYTLGANKNIVISDTDNTGKVIVKLGSTNTNTSLEVHDSTNTALVKVKGDGSLDGFTIAKMDDVDVTGIANDKILKYNNSNSKWEIADDSGGGPAADFLSFGAWFATGNANGTQITIGAVSGSYVNIWDGITLVSQNNASSDFTLNAGNGTVTYDTALSRTVQINAMVYFENSSGNKDVIEVRLLRSGSQVQKVRGRVDSNGGAVTPFVINTCLNLVQGNIFKLDAKNLTAGGSNVDIQVHATSISIYGA